MNKLGNWLIYGEQRCINFCTSGKMLSDNCLRLFVITDFRHRDDNSVLLHPSAYKRNDVKDESPCEITRTSDSFVSEIVKKRSYLHRITSSSVSVDSSLIHGQAR